MADNSNNDVDLTQFGNISDDLQLSFGDDGNSQRSRLSDASGLVMSPNTLLKSSPQGMNLVHEQQTVPESVYTEISSQAAAAPSAVCPFNSF